MNEQELSEEDKKIFKRQMLEISSLTIFNHKHLLSEWRTKIFSFSEEFKQPWLEITHVVYCLLSSGIDGNDIVRALKLVMELAADAEMSVILAEQVLIVLINGGLMKVEKAGELSKRILLNLARRGFQLPEE